jgi:hypothetical protein
VKDTVGLELRNDPRKTVIISNIAMFKAGVGPRVPGIADIDSENGSASFQTMSSEKGAHESSRSCD